MISRLGNPFTPPQWFLDSQYFRSIMTNNLFSTRVAKGYHAWRRTLRWEAWISIHSFDRQNHQLASLARYNFPGTFLLHLNMIGRTTFLIFLQIFDIPSQGDKPFEDRIEFLKKTFGPGGSRESKQVEVVEHTLATSRQHVLDKLKEIETLGGEGLMLRKAGSYVTLSTRGVQSSRCLNLQPVWGETLQHASKDQGNSLPDYARNNSCSQFDRPSMMVRPSLLVTFQEKARTRVLLVLSNVKWPPKR